MSWEPQPSLPPSLFPAPSPPTGRPIGRSGSWEPPAPNPSRRAGSGSMGSSRLSVATPRTSTTLPMISARCPLGRVPAWPKAGQSPMGATLFTPFITKARRCRSGWTLTTKIFLRGRNLLALFPVGLPRPFRLSRRLIVLQTPLPIHPPIPRSTPRPIALPAHQRQPLPQPTRLGYAVLLPSLT